MAQVLRDRSVARTHFMFDRFDAVEMAGGGEGGSFKAQKTLRGSSVQRPRGAAYRSVAGAGMTKWSSSRSTCQNPR